MISFFHAVILPLTPDLLIYRLVIISPNHPLHAKEVLSEVRQKLASHCRVYNTVIRESVRIKEAPIAGQTITEYQTNHPSAQDYRDFAQEFVQHD